MEQEYCIIYGYNDNDPGPFVIGVTKDQDMINGFREEHYHFCKGGEVVKDSNYDNLAADYEIKFMSGHYMTSVMVTKFMDFLLAEYNQISMFFDNLERDVEYLRFTDDEQNVVEDGFSFLRDHLFDMAYSFHITDRYGSDDEILNSVYASVMNVPLCLDKFLASYQPEPDLY